MLHGFSFALVIGILIGTYSSIAIAAPILVAYQDWRANRGNGRWQVLAWQGKSAAGDGKGLKPRPPGPEPENSCNAIDGIGSSAA